MCVCVCVCVIVTLWRLCGLGTANCVDDANEENLISATFAPASRASFSFSVFD